MKFQLTYVIGLFSFFSIFLRIDGQSQSQSVLLVDDYEIFPDNSLGLESSGFSSHPGKALIEPTTISSYNAFSKTGESLKIRYDLTKEPNSFVVYSSPLPNIDLDIYNYLSFWVKGGQGGEYFSLELKRDNDEFAKVAVWNYLKCGPNKEWQKVVIPLDAFWNLSERKDIIQINFVFEEHKSIKNGSPLKSELFIDDLIFGSYFIGRLKIDSFDDKIASNATDGPNGIIAEKDSTNFSQELFCQSSFQNDCDCQAKIYYDVSDDYGGIYFILGEEENIFNEFIGKSKNLLNYQGLYIEVAAPLESENSGVIGLKLKVNKNDNPYLSSEYFTFIFDVGQNKKNYFIPFSDFLLSTQFWFGLIPLDTPIIQQLNIIISSSSTNQKGHIIVDNIEFRVAEKVFPDNIIPSKPINLEVNGLPFSNYDMIKLLSSNKISAEIGNVDERLESISLEYKVDCIWQTLEKKYAPFSNLVEFFFEGHEILEDLPLEMRIVTENYNGLKNYGDLFRVIINSDNPLNADQLLRNSLEVFQLLRQENGVYLDALAIDRVSFHPASVATTGMGLISLCIADAMGYIENAAVLVEESLKSMNGLKSGFIPERNCIGWFRRLIDQNTGKQVWNSEFSSIDSGILIAGALFCKKYFQNNPNIAQLADALYLSIDWSSMIANPQSGGIYFASNENGQERVGIALPFNEYMIVAWLAKNDIRNNNFASRLWEIHYSGPYNQPKSKYEGIEVLSDFSGNFLSNFAPQFNYYLCHPFTTDSEYFHYFEQAMKADSLWWRNNTNTDCFSWGFGAGTSTSWVPGGYNADNILEHPGSIVSPHIIGGFIPANPKILNDLIRSYKTSLGFYHLPNTEKTPILWRFSTENFSWRASDIQGADFSSMLFGLASHPDLLGRSFFEKYNDFSFPFDGPLPNCPNDTNDQLLLKIKQNRPNPFSESTIIEFLQSEKEHIVFIVFNSTGQEVFQKDLGILEPGRHQIYFTRKLENGISLPSGIYFFKIQADNYSEVIKVCIV